MNHSIRSYKGLIYYQHEDIDCVEISVDSSDFNNEVFCINTLCHLVELSAILKTKYIIFNKLNSDFELLPELYDFVKNTIYKQLKVLGVKKVLFLTKSENHDKFYQSFNIISSYMIGFLEKEKALEWIKSDCINSNYIS